MGSESINEDEYKHKYFQLCRQRTMELNLCRAALLAARMSMQKSEDIDVVNNALNIVFYC